MRDFTLLSLLSEADRWRFATLLIEGHGVAAESVLDAIPESTATAKRLRCALFDAKIIVGESLAINRSVEGSQFLRPLSAYGGRLKPNLVLASLEKEMIRAIQRGDIAMLCDYLDQAADPSLGLNAALSTQSAPILALLLEKGADPECILPSIAESALMAAVKAGDCTFVDLLLKICNKGGSLSSIDFVHDGWTPMMVAVQQNHRRMVTILLPYRPNPAFETSNDCAATVARQLSFERVLPPPPPNVDDYMLSEYSFASNSRRSVQDVVTFDKSLAKEVMSHPMWLTGLAGSGKSQILKLQTLSHEFRKQHRLIWERSTTPDDIDGPAVRLINTKELDREAFAIYQGLTASQDQSSGSTYDMRRPPYNYTTVLESDCSEAWRSGINVMRDLCVGKLPSSLNDVLMFIAFAKAVYSSGLIPASLLSESNFDADLGRWQMPFEGNPSLLAAYQQAVKNVWEVDVEQLSHMDSPDSETLAIFQELATNLANEVQRSLNLQVQGSDDGLLTSQKRWLDRIVMEDCDDLHCTVRQYSQPYWAQASPL